MSDTGTGADSTVLYDQGRSERDGTCVGVKE